MMSVGLTGSIAMGKSEVSRIILTQGIPVFDSDREVHVLYDSTEGADLLRPHVPEAIVSAKIDRGLLSKLVLQNPARLNELETIVHTEIASRRSKFKHHAETQGFALVVFDIPLLFEKHIETEMDATVVVSCAEDIQRKRALSRPGMTPEKLELIVSRQMPDAEKRKRADYLIENNGSLKDLETRTLFVLNSIKKAHTL
jgi:dephospho-CoA kinase